MASTDQFGGVLVEDAPATGVQTPAPGRDRFGGIAIENTPAAVPSFAELKKRALARQAAEAKPGMAPSTAMVSAASPSAMPAGPGPARDQFGGIPVDEGDAAVNRINAGATAAKGKAEEAWAWMTKPLLDLFPRMTPEENREYAETMEKFPDPFAFDALLNDLSTMDDPQQKKPDPAANAAVTGIRNSLADNANFMTSPLGIATMGLGAAPKGVQAAASVGFGLQAMYQMPDLWRQFAAEKDPEKKAGVLGDMVTQALVIGGAGLGVAQMGSTEVPKVAQGGYHAAWVANAATQMPVLLGRLRRETDPGERHAIIEEMTTRMVEAAGGAHGIGKLKDTEEEEGEEKYDLAENLIETEKNKPAADAAPPAGTQPGSSSSESASAGGAARPPETDLFGGIPVERPPSEVAAGEVRQVPTREIAVRPDLMQFKRMDDTGNGVNREDQITSKYDPMKAGNLLLWEPIDPAQHGLEEGQNYIVANGHHRFARALEDEVPAQNAQVLREADGFSANDARTLAAEVNIADGKGTIYDQAKFFRNTAATYGQDEAVARAGQIGARGRKAASIAFSAGDPLFESFINERVTPEQAAAIAEGAPANNAMQRLGIARAIEGDEPETIRNFLQAVRVKAGSENARQIDLFGNDDEALREAEAMGRRAQTIQREIRDQITSVAGAAKRPEKARALGVDVTDPLSVQRNLEQLQGLRDRFSEWSKDTDLVRLVQDRTRPAGEVVKELKEKSILTHPANHVPPPAEHGMAAGGERKGPQRVVYAQPGRYTLGGTEALENVAAEMKRAPLKFPAGNREFSVGRPALKKMIAGNKAYARERIVAIQHLRELAAEASLKIRPDDGRDPQVANIWEWRAPFGFGGKLFTARMLAKEFTPEAARGDKLHSLRLEDLELLPLDRSPSAEAGALSIIPQESKAGGAPTVASSPRDQGSAESQEGKPEEHGMASGTAAPPKTGVQTPAPGGLPQGGTMPGQAQPAISLPSTRSWFANAVLPLQKFFAPQTIDPAARAVGNIMRDYNAEAALAVARADHELARARADFDKTPTPRGWKYDPARPLPRNYAFIDESEQGGANLSPADRRVKAQMDGMIDQWIDEVHAVAPKAMQHLIQNYFPHLWTDEKKAARVYAEVLAKRPLEGSKGFMKQRVHQLFRDGLAAGLTPATDNPVDMFLMKMHEIRKFIMAQKVLQEAKAIGARRFVFVGEKPPEGWTMVDDRTSTVNGPPFVKVQEAYDAQMRGKTLDLLEKLGVPHQRVVKIAGHPNWWGRAVDIDRGQIETRFAGPDQVMWHELGHVLEYRYKMSRELTRTPALNAELTKLAEERARGAKASGNFRKYIQTTDEKMATVLQAYVHAPELMGHIAPTVKGAFAKFIQAHPELHDIEDIRPGIAIGTGEAKVAVNGMVTLGHYYMPEGAAAVVNNFLSPGLAGKAPYRGIRAISNVLNSAQLGFSAFHLGFTSLDATVSRAAVGMQYLTSGHPIKGVADIVGSPLAPVTNYLLGRRVQLEMLEPGTQPKEIGEIAKLAQVAGLRAAPDPMFRGGMTRSLMRGLRQGGIANYALTPLKAPFALMEQVMKPIADYVVPRQKLGVFADMARFAMDRLGPDATHEQIREAMARAADSTENRMGQMTYDNLFHNRIWKDLATVGFRSYGWQLGKYREALGAVYDTATTVQRMKAGDPLMSHRMAYAVALPMVVGLYGAMTNYLMTGEAPGTQDGKDTGFKGMLMDSFFPRNGRKDAQGNAQRLMLPSYLKDMISDWHDFPDIQKMGESFYHKLNPVIGIAVDEFRNRDFYDVEIRDPKDPVMNQAMDGLLYALGQAKPFSVAGGMKLTEEGGDTASSWVLPFFGVVPAKKALTQTPAETRAGELIQDSLPQGARSHSEAARSQLAAQLTRDLRNHEPDAMENYRRAAARGQITAADAQRVKEKLAMTPLQYQVKQMAVTGAMEVWDLANSRERQQLRGLVTAKIRNARSINEEQKRAYLRVLIGTQ